MVDWPIALISGVSAFGGGAASSWIKYRFDRASYNYDTNRRKTESAVRHLRAMADHIFIMRDEGLDFGCEINGHSYRKRLDTVRAECDALGMSQKQRLRDEAEKIQTRLWDPMIFKPDGLNDDEAREVHENLTTLARELQRTWREQQSRWNRSKPLDADSSD